MRRKGLALRRSRSASARRRLSACRNGRMERRRSPGQGRIPRPRLAILALPARCPHLHARRGRICLACPRIRSRRHGLCSRRARPLGRLGRCRRSARAARQLSARHHIRSWPSTATAARSTATTARAACTRASTSTSLLQRPAQLPRVHRSRRRCRLLLRRLALRRTRRRPVPRRSAAQNVRPRADRGLPRVQDALGSRQSHESRQAL